MVLSKLVLLLIAVSILAMTVDSRRNIIISRLYFLFGLLLSSFASDSKSKKSGSKYMCKAMCLFLLFATV